jgi:hypothetical protein
MRTAILGRLVGGLLMVILSLVAWRTSSDHRSTILLLLAAWSACGVGMVRFLLASRRQVKREKLSIEEARILRRSVERQHEAVGQIRALPRPHLHLLILPQADGPTAVDDLVLRRVGSLMSSPSSRIMICPVSKSVCKCR